MTSENKIDAQLAEWMGRDANAPLPVLIEMADQPQAPSTIDRGAEMDALAGRGAETQASVREQLHELGVPDAQIESFTIVNALAASLTASQIRAMAGRGDVQFIRYNGQANVAI